MSKKKTTEPIEPIEPSTLVSSDDENDRQDKSSESDDSEAKQTRKSKNTIEPSNLKAKAKNKKNRSSSNDVNESESATQNEIKIPSCVLWKDVNFENLHLEPGVLRVSKKADENGNNHNYFTHDIKYNYSVIDSEGRKHEALKAFNFSLDCDVNYGIVRSSKGDPMLIVTIDPNDEELVAFGGMKAFGMNPGFCSQLKDQLLTLLLEYKDDHGWGEVENISEFKRLASDILVSIKKDQNKKIVKGAKPAIFIKLLEIGNPGDPNYKFCKILTGRKVNGQLESLDPKLFEGIRAKVRVTITVQQLVVAAGKITFRTICPSFTILEVLPSEESFVDLNYIENLVNDNEHQSRISSQLQEIERVYRERGGDEGYQRRKLERERRKLKDSESEEKSSANAVSKMAKKSGAAATLLEVAKNQKKKNKKANASEDVPAKSKKNRQVSEVSENETQDDETVDSSVAEESSKASSSEEDEEETERLRSKTGKAKR